MAEAIATEVRAHWNVNRAQGLYKVWYGVSCFSPEMNLMRHPLWGRNQVGSLTSVILRPPKK